MPPKQQRNAPAMDRVEDEEDETMDVGMMDFQKYLDPDFSKNFMAGLPEPVRRRAQVLSAYNDDYVAMQKTYKDKETEILRRYDELFAPILQRRREVVTGAAVDDTEVEKGMPAVHKGVVEVDQPAGAASTGIENFWLRVLQHHVVVASTIEEHDEAVLKHLIDVTSSVVDGEYGSFQVVFTFSPNEFFEEETITATVKAKETASELNLTPITWKPGKNVTMNTITKKQRAKRSGQTRSITREVPQPSFFWLFSSKAEHDDEKDDDEEEEEEDDEEQRISTLEVLHTCIIPNAVRYYTGEAPDGSSDADDGDDDEEEEEEEEEEEIHIQRGRGGAARGGHRGGRGGRGF